MPYESSELPDLPANEPSTRRRRWPYLDLTATQLVATALAAVTATLAASFLGVTGTVIGAALASVVATTGNAVYSHSLHRTRARVRGVPADQVFSRETRATDRSDATTAQRKPSNRGRITFAHLAGGAVAVFAVVLALVTGVELMAGRPVSAIVRGDAGAGTSLFGTAGSPPTSGRGGVPTVTRTVTPSVVVTTPTVTRTAAPVTTTTTTTPRPPAPSAPGSGSSGSDVAPGGSSTQLG